MRGAGPALAAMPAMPMLIRDLDAFYLEHRRCGELDGGVEGELFG